MALLPTRTPIQHSDSLPRAIETLNLFPSYQIRIPEDSHQPLFPSSNRNSTTDPLQHLRLHHQCSFLPKGSGRRRRRQGDHCPCSFPLLCSGCRCSCRRDAVEQVLGLLPLSLDIGFLRGEAFLQKILPEEREEGVNVLSGAHGA